MSKIKNNHIKAKGKIPDDDFEDYLAKCFKQQPYKIYRHKRTHRLNIMVTEPTFNMIQTLSIKYKMSISDLLRQAIFFTFTKQLPLDSKEKI